jgi:hypothetical protein
MNEMNKIPTLEDQMKEFESIATEILYPFALVKNADGQYAYNRDLKIFKIWQIARGYI